MGGRPGNASATNEEMTAPAMICPSPPMLMTPARKAMHIPTPTSSSGIDLTAVSARLLAPEKAPLTIAR